mgnify:CR=1 FL=1
MTSFNLKTRPWRVMSRSDSQSIAVQKWLIQQGIRWPDGGGACRFDRVTWFSNVKEGRQVTNHLVHLGRVVEHTAVPEIKIQYAGGPGKEWVIAADFPSAKEISAWRASLA